MRTNPRHAIAAALEPLRRRLCIPEDEDVFELLRSRLEADVENRRSPTEWMSTNRSQATAQHPEGEFSIARNSSNNSYDLVFRWSSGGFRLLAANAKSIEVLKNRVARILRDAGPHGGPEPRGGEEYRWREAPTTDNLAFPLGGGWECRALLAGEDCYRGAFINPDGNFWIEHEGSFGDISLLAGARFRDQQLYLSAEERGVPFMSLRVRGRRRALTFHRGPGLIGYLREPPYSFYLFLVGPNRLSVVRSRRLGRSAILVAHGDESVIRYCEGLPQRGDEPIDSPSHMWSSMREPTRWTVGPVTASLNRLASLRPRVRNYLVALASRVQGRGANYARQIIWRAGFLAERGHEEQQEGTQQKLREFLGIQLRGDAKGYQAGSRWLAENAGFYRHVRGRIWALDLQKIGDPSPSFLAEIDELLGRM